jgi:hypothetical protein
MEENITKSNNVTINLKGGLGNYMFQVAACEAYALEYNLNPIYNFDLALRIHGDIRLYLNNVFRNLAPGTHEEIEFSYSEPRFEYNPLPKSDGRIILDGYFQSELYFIKYENEIRELFSESEEIKEYIDRKYEKLFSSKQLVSIHVRRGDYVKYPDHHPMLTKYYYRKAIRDFVEKGYRSFFVFSDDIEWCKKNFVGETFEDVDIFYSNNERDIIDMYLMARCGNHIIGNSSFSWWGAWLNPRKNKQVIAPKQWFGKALKGHNTENLLPENWRVM